MRPAGGVAPYTYSLDDISYQASAFFTGLPAATYTGWVKDANGCKTSVSVTIGSNPIAVTAYAGAASSCGASNGSIQLFLTGGVNPYMFSINGTTYQTSNVFTGLAPNTYTGYVKDSKGCIGLLTNIVVGPNCPSPLIAGTVTKTTIKTEKVPVNNILKVQAYPNPTSTEFILQLEGFGNDKVNIIVTDIMGRVVFHIEGSGKQQYRFGDKFIAGIYLVQVVQGGQKQSIKLIKE